MIPNGYMYLYFIQRCYACFWGSEVCLRCLWSVSEVSNLCMLFTAFMYAAMNDAWCLPVNKCYQVRSGFYLSGLFTLLMIPKLIQDPADQAQHKSLVLPQCTWGQWNPIPLCNMVLPCDLIIHYGEVCKWTEAVHKHRTGLCYVLTIIIMYSLWVPNSAGHPQF